MRTLVIGGTRNLGPALVGALLARGDDVTVLHRGVTPHTFPAGVRTVHADRTDASALGAAIGKAAGGADWDLVVDNVLFTGEEARSLVEILDGRVGRYVALSTGQVYLVREGVERPFRESDYDGAVMPKPADAADVPDWRYGIGKRDAEDALFRAHGERGFPAITLRLPMINSERDHYGRLRNYVARMLDGEPLLIPAGPHLELRHVYGGDVVQAVLRAADPAVVAGRSWNISQLEGIALGDFLEVVARLLGRPLRTASVPRERLMAEGLLRSASPFSDPWMSALDSSRSVAELGMRYTPLEEYLAVLVEDARRQAVPAGYGQRAGELALLGEQKN